MESQTGDSNGGQQGAKKRELRHGWRRHLSTGLLTLLVGTLTLVVAMYSFDGFREFVCKSADESTGMQPPLCDDEFAVIQVDEAEAFLRVFLSGASGAQPGNTHAQLSESMKETYSRTEFIDQWSNSSWTELLWEFDGKDVRIQKSDAWNTFRVTYRNYQAGAETSCFPNNGQVEVVRMSYELRKEDGKIRLHWENRAHRAAVSEVDFPVIYLKEDSALFEVPSRHGQTTMLEERSPKGGCYKALCKLSNHHDTNWYRTPQGWIDQDHVETLKDEEDVKFACSDIYRAVSSDLPPRQFD